MNKIHEYKKLFNKCTPNISNVCFIYHYSLPSSHLSSVFCLCIIFGLFCFQGYPTYSFNGCA